MVDVGVGERREERAAGRDDERDERDDDRVEVSCLTSVPSLVTSARRCSTSVARGFGLLTPATVGVVAAAAAIKVGGGVATSIILSANSAS